MPQRTAPYHTVDGRRGQSFYTTALREIGFGERLRDRATFMDNALQGADHAARIATLPGVAAEDDPGGACLRSVMDDLLRLPCGLHLWAAGDQDRHGAIVHHSAISENKELKCLQRG